MHVSDYPAPNDDLNQPWGESEMLNVRNDLKKKARKMLGKKLRTTMCLGSSDLVQETLMVTLMNLASVIGRPKRAVYFWMISVMRHRVLKHARELKIRERECGHDARPLETWDSNLETGLINAELKQMIKDKLTGLDEVSSRMFVLRYFEDRQLHEIAELVGISKDAVRANLYRTLVKIRQELKESIS